eukprot:16178-Heterococcus_DN1.PRE.5
MPLASNGCAWTHSHIMSERLPERSVHSNNAVQQYSYMLCTAENLHSSSTSSSAMNRLCKVQHQCIAQEAICIKDQ